VVWWTESGVTLGAGKGPTGDAWGIADWAEFCTYLHSTCPDDVPFTKAGLKAWTRPPSCDGTKDEIWECIRRMDAQGQSYWPGAPAAGTAAFVAAGTGEQLPGGHGLEALRARLARVPGATATWWPALVGVGLAFLAWNRWGRR
jgi:hypothetical protein